MTNEQLTLDIQNGNRAALTELWGAVRPLLFSLAWKFYIRQGKERCSSHGVTLEDLQQETFFALCDAVQAYKPEKGYQLTTYLHYATENRFKACMGIQGKADALNHADRLERPLPGEEERQQGGHHPRRTGTSGPGSGGRCIPAGAAPGRSWRGLRGPASPTRGRAAAAVYLPKDTARDSPGPGYQPPGGSQSGTAGLAASPGKACCSGAENRLLGGRGLSRHGVVFLVLRAGKRGGKAGRKQGKRHLNNQKNISSYKEKGSDLRQVLPERLRCVGAARRRKGKILG